MPDVVRYDITDRVAVLTIDNPPVNALSPTVWEAIDQGVQRANADPAADAIVLIGSGTTFTVYLPRSHATLTRSVEPSPTGDAMSKK